MQNSLKNFIKLIIGRKMVYNRNELDYNALIDKAMRYIVKLALQKVQKITDDNLCFLFTINTKNSGVVLPDYIKKAYPEEITLILQHQFSNLTVKNNNFSVDLSFSGKVEHVVIPFSSLISFTDKIAGINLSFNSYDNVYLIEDDDTFEDAELFDYLYNKAQEANNNVDTTSNVINFNDLKMKQHK